MYIHILYVINFAFIINYMLFLKLLHVYIPALPASNPIRKTNRPTVAEYMMPLQMIKHTNRASCLQPIHKAMNCFQLLHVQKIASLHTMNTIKMNHVYYFWVVSNVTLLKYIHHYLMLDMCKDTYY